MKGYDTKLENGAPVECDKKAEGDCNAVMSAFRSVPSPPLSLVYPPTKGSSPNEKRSAQRRPFLFVQTSKLTPLQYIGCIANRQ